MLILGFFLVLSDWVEFSSYIVNFNSSSSFRIANIEL